jgi:hypothetical protein
VCSRGAILDQTAAPAAGAGPAAGDRLRRHTPGASNAPPPRPLAAAAGALADAGMHADADLRQNSGDMTANEPLVYTEDELRSFLPSGWRLLGASPAPAEITPQETGAWDGGKRVWRTRVVDNVDFDWPLVVKAADAAKLGDNGRIEALRLAMDKLYRERLG